MKQIFTTKFCIFIIILSLSFSEKAFSHWNSRGPFGGSVSCIHTVDTIIYLGTYTGGVFRSVNKNGESWRAIPVGLNTGKINALTSIGKYILAGTDNGIFVSKNIGGLWTPANNGLTNMVVNSLVCTENIILAGTNAGIFKSLDSGKTWSEQSDGMGRIKINKLIYGSGKFYAGTEGGGVFVSELSHNSWASLNNGLPSNATITALQIINQELWIGTNEKIFRQDISSGNWTEGTNGLNAGKINDFIGVEPNVFVATNTGLYKSSIAEINWSVVNNGIKSDPISSLGTFNSKLYAGTTLHGVFSGDLSGNTWKSLLTGFTNLKAFALAVKDRIVIAATNNGVFVSIDESTNFTRRNKGLNDSLNVTSLSFSGTYLLAGTKNSGVYLSRDTAKNWTRENMHLSETAIKKVIIGPGNTAFIVTEANKIYYSIISSHIHWEPLNSGLPAGIDISDLESDGQDLLLSSYNQGVYRLTNLAWAEINEGLNNKQVIDIATGDDKVFIATPEGVFSSGKQQVLWSSSSNGLTHSTSITSIAVYKHYVLAGFEGGVEVSASNGQHWEAFETLLNLPEYAKIENITFSTNRIFVTTPENSVYSNSQGELPVGLKEKHTEVSDEFSVFPNPSAGEFKLINKTGELIDHVLISDIAGQVIRQIIPVSNDIITVNDILPGTYLIQVRGAQKSQILKVIIH